MPETQYRITARLPSSLRFNEDGTVDIELFKEGEWKHPAAPGGWFKVTRERIQAFINNFNAGVCGYEIPLEFNHSPDSEKTPGWVVKMYEKPDNGTSSLWGTLKITDPVTRDRVKNGSLKYISPTVVSDYLDTASGQMFEVIRSATLTNYPHIKNLHPAVVNFEEIQNQEEQMKSEKEILENNELQLEDLDSITLEQLTKGGIELEYLTEKQIEDLAEKFDMTVQQFKEQYPVAGTKTYGTKPRIKVPANIPPERKKEFLDTFTAMMEKHQDAEKAMKATMRKMGIAMMEEETQSSAKEFAESAVNYIKKILGVKAPEKTEEDVEPTKFEELQNQVKELTEYKKRTEFAEDTALVDSFKSITPAAKKIVQTLLATGRETSLKFEEKTISMHDMLVALFQEMKANPTINMFAEISHKENNVHLSEDLNTNIAAYMKDHPNVEFRKAYDICFAEMKKANGK